MARPWFDHFRLVAPFYDRVFGSYTTLDELGELLALPVDGWLLDAGGGTGRMSKDLIGLAGGVVVVDFSHGMLRQAQRVNGLHAANGQVEQLPFAAGQFERILIVDAFHHFFHHKEALADLWRVLKPGGRLVIEEPNIAHWPVKLIALGETLLLMRSRFFRAEALRALFTPLPGAVVSVTAPSDALYIRLVAEKRG